MIEHSPQILASEEQATITTIKHIHTQVDTCPTIIQTPHHHRLKVAGKRRVSKCVVVVDSDGVAQVTAGVAQTVVGQKEQVGRQCSVHKAVSTSKRCTAVTGTCSRKFHTR